MPLSTARRILPVMDRVFRCPVCGDVIGLYEPVLAVRHGHSRRTSLANEPSLRDGEETLMHRACATKLTAPQANGSTPASG
jgi:hypothetical protein